MDIQYSKWIRMRGSGPETVPVFRREFGCDAPVARAELEITAAGVYEATLNGQRVGDFILAPGWTWWWAVAGSGTGIRPGRGPSPTGSTCAPP